MSQKMQPIRGLPQLIEQPQILLGARVKAEIFIQIIMALMTVQIAEMKVMVLVTIQVHILSLAQVVTVFHWCYLSQDNILLQTIQ